MEEKRKRGRPPGPPKEPKPPAKRGRPSPWSAPTTVDVKTRMPEHVERAYRYPEFKSLIDAAAWKFLEQLNLTSSKKQDLP